MSVSQDLQRISTSTWKDDQRADQSKRAKVAADLKECLRWKTWEEIQ
jgi:hypothetical protein